MFETSLTLEFADGEYRFDLKLPQLAELQEKRDCGIFRLYGRVMRGRAVFEGQVIGLPHEGEAYAEDLWETIRLALIGGGEGRLPDDTIVKVDAILAKRLVERYCHSAPLRESWSVAAAVLAARVEGYIPPKKAEPGKAPAAKPERKKASTSRRSSTTAQSSEPIGEI